MVYLVYLIGLMIAFGGLMLLVRPGWIIKMIESGAERPWFYAFAVGIRALLGVLLITLASFSRYPLLMEILGWVMVAAAIMLLLMGLRRFNRLVGWMMEKVRPFVWVGGLFGVLFGLFLIYAFVS